MPVVCAHRSLVSPLVVLPGRDSIVLLILGLSPKNGTHDISTAGDLPLYLLQNQTKGV
jgi:hypothetical protein